MERSRKHSPFLNSIRRAATAAAALCVIITLALIPAQTALAHSDDCPQGQHRPVIPNANFNRSNICVNTADLEFADWCLQKLADNGHNQGSIFYINDSKGRNLQCAVGTNASQGWCDPFAFDGYYDGPEAPGLYCWPSNRSACPENVEYKPEFHSCQCPAGFVQDANNPAECACPEGMNLRTNSNGETECAPKTTCEIQNRVERGGNACGPCAPGFAQNAQALCVPPADCAAQNRVVSPTAAAECAECLPGFAADENNQCAPAPNCAEQGRQPDSNSPFLCAECLPGLSENESGTCAGPANCAQQNRIPLSGGSQCGQCLADFAPDFNGNCAPVRDCARHNRQQLGPACGLCADGFIENNGVCVPFRDCAAAGRETNPNSLLSCGTCAAGFQLNFENLPPIAGEFIAAFTVYVAGESAASVYAEAAKENLALIAQNAPGAIEQCQSAGQCPSVARRAYVYAAYVLAGQTDAQARAAVADNYGNSPDPDDINDAMFDFILLLGTPDCVSAAACEQQNRVYASASTCRECAPGFAENSAQMCAPVRECAAENRQVGVSRAECGACRPGHSEVNGQCERMRDCVGENRARVGPAECAQCLPGFVQNAQGACVLVPDCAALNRADDDSAECGECLPGFTQADGQCRRRLDCSADNRVAVSPYSCGQCLEEYLQDESGACVRVPDCAGQNRTREDQAPFQCGQCLPGHLEVAGQCEPARDCPAENRDPDPGGAATQCGPCATGFNQLFGECAGPAACAELNRVYADPETCGTCRDGFIESGAECVAARDCAALNRARDGPFSCLQCLPGFVENHLGLCVPPLDCAELNRAQTQPFACGQCLNGFAPDDHGACLSMPDCRAQNRLQSSPLQCGPCRPGFAPPLESEMESCRPARDCSAQNRQGGTLSVEPCGPCADGFHDIAGTCHDNLAVACAEFNRIPNDDGDACGTCADGFAPNALGVCQKSPDCPAQNRIQLAPLECGQCADGFTENPEGMCAAIRDCPAENRESGLHPTECGSCLTGLAGGYSGMPNEYDDLPDLAKNFHDEFISVSASDADAGGIARQLPAVLVTLFNGADPDEIFHDNDVCNACRHSGWIAAAYYAHGIWVDGRTDLSLLASEAHDFRFNFRPDLWRELYAKAIGPCFSHAASCEEENRLYADASTCGDCVSGFAEIGNSMCAPIMDCAGLNRESGANAAVCGTGCLPGFAPDGSGDCRPVRDCAAEHRESGVNETACGSCLPGFMGGYAGMPNEYEDLPDLAKNFHDEFITVSAGDADAVGIAEKLPVVLLTLFNGADPDEIFYAGGICEFCRHSGWITAAYYAHGIWVDGRTDLSLLAREARDSVHRFGFQDDIWRELYAKGIGSCFSHSARCEEENRLYSDSLTCGGCVSGFAEDSLGSCSAELDCAGLNRESGLSVSECGDCISGHVEVSSGGECAEVRECLELNRVQLSGSSCGGCLSGYSLTLGACLSSRDCELEGRERLGPFECGECVLGYAESRLGGGGDCVYVAELESRCGLLNRERVGGDCGAECASGLSSLIGGRCADLDSGGDYGEVFGREGRLLGSGLDMDMGLLSAEELSCVELGGIRTGGGRICMGADGSGTFCVLDSLEAFSCLGLFRHVWDCNRLGRWGLDPFLCGGECEEGYRALGGRCCLESELDSDGLCVEE